LSGSSESWESYGQWHSKLNEGLYELPNFEKDNVDQLLEGVDNEIEKARILYHYMQDNTRYVNVAIDIGGLKPYPASYVCENKYGDCKALTVYMKALLKYAGIESYYTIIYAGKNYVRINEEIPSQQFNHVILQVLAEGDTLWLENTSSYLPFNYLGTFTQGRKALMVDGDRSKIVETPKMRLTDVSTKNNYRFELDVTGQGTLTILKNLKGDDAENHKYYLNQGDKLKHEEYLKQSLIFKHYKIKDWNVSQSNRDNDNVLVRIDLDIERYVRKLSNMLIIQPFSSISLQNFELEKPNERLTPLRINYPINELDSIVYKISDSESYLTELPKSGKIESEFGSYEETYKEIGEEIIFIRSVIIKAGEYRGKEYNSFYEFIKTINQMQKQSAIILNQQ
jgi:hypothetical protein